MRIGIITALAAEAATIPSATGSLLGVHEFMVKVAGAGPERAARAAAALVEADCEVLLSWGLAGGLEPRLRPGALLIASEVVAEDTGELSCDPPLHAALLSRLTPLAAVSGRLYSAPIPVVARADKADLCSTRRAAACDMESAAIAAVAHARAARFGAVRCVVDPAGFTVPQSALAGLGSDGQSHASAVALQLLTHPRELVPLLRLAGWYRTAMAALARAARALCY